MSIDDAAQRRFDELRRRFFPPERLHVGAHVTLFHALPGEREPDIARALAETCATTPAFPVAVAGLRFLGRGVAYRLTAPDALELQAGLRARFDGWLTPQDRGHWWPHVTVQNKVAPDVARRTQALLEAEMPPAGVKANGLALWRYLGGPWEAVARYDFTPPG